MTLPGERQGSPVIRRATAGHDAFDSSFGSFPAAFTEAGRLSPPEPRRTRRRIGTAVHGRSVPERTAPATGEPLDATPLPRFSSYLPPCDRSPERSRSREAHLHVHDSLPAVGRHREAVRQGLTCMFTTPSLRSVAIDKPFARGSLACSKLSINSSKSRKTAYPPYLLHGQHVLRHHVDTLGRRERCVVPGDDFSILIDRRDADLPMPPTVLGDALWHATRAPIPPATRAPWEQE